MTNRVSLCEIPFLLGFDEVERIVDDIMRGTNDAYPPYNISQKDDHHYHITLAVAGFDEKDLEILLEGKQLIIRGKKSDAESLDDGGVFLHRGIAARQFERRFVLADGIKVEDADLKNGLLTVNLERLSARTDAQVIAINGGDRKKSRVIESEKADAKSDQRPRLKAAS